MTTRMKPSTSRANIDINSSTIPIAAVLLPLMAYTNLWITDRVPGLDWFEQTLPRVLMILLVILYLALIWISGPSPSRVLVRRVRQWRSLIAFGLIIVNVLVPTFLFIEHRLENGPAPENVIDWPLQIEAGSDLVLQGKSPYGVDYSGTEMTVWSERANFPDNPAIRHAIHLPVNFLLAAGASPLWRGLTGWFDARVLLIAAYLVVFLLAPKLASQWEDGHALQIGLALNPLLVDTFVVGLSDYLLLAWLVLALVLRQRGYVKATAAVLGLAVATRQFSWVLMPIYLTAEWFALSETNLRNRAKLMLSRIWPLAAVAGGTILPFFLHNPRGFYTDVIAFGSGGIADAYPIGGPETFGLSAIVLALGWAKSQYEQFPFSLIQMISVLPLIAYGVWSQRRENTMRRMLLSYLLVLAMFLFTGRFMHSNYVGFLFALVLLTCFADETPMATQQAAPSRSNN